MGTTAIHKFRKRILILEKRERFVVQTLFLTLGILLTQLIWEDYRFLMVVILSIFTYLSAAWSLREDIKKIEWLTLFILPVFYMGSVSMFYFLLPGRWISRIFITTVFALGMYAIMLIENIYNVAAIRTIQLLRAAQSIGLLISLIIIFLLSGIIYSLRMNYFWNSLLIMPGIYFLAFQSLWSIHLEDKPPPALYLYSALVSFIIGQVALALSFWPVNISAFSLFITSTYYTIISVVQQHLQEKLFKNTYREYIFVILFTFILLLITTHWS